MAHRVPCPLNEAWYTGRISSDLFFETLGTGSEPPSDVIHIRVFDKTLMGENWMHEANRLLRHVHHNPRAIPFRFPDVVDDLLKQASGKLDRKAQQLAVDCMN